MPRLMPADELWPKLREILCQHGIYSKKDFRLADVRSVRNMVENC